MPITIKDIAKHCGVGIGTVSRVINGHKNVSKKTKTAVFEAIEKFNFTPNQAAQNLATINTNKIAVIVRGANNPFFAKMIIEIQKALHKSNYSMELRFISTSDNEILTANELILEKKVIGIIFLGGRFNYKNEDLKSISVPFVCTTYINSFGNLEKSSYSSVAIDDKLQAKKIVKHFHDNGHKNIAIILPSTNDNSISQLRYNGYKEALSELGLKFNQRLTALTLDFSLENAYKASVELLNRGESFSAIFSVSDLMAVGIIKALYDNGISVPNDCSIMGIDGLDFSKYLIPALSTLKQPTVEMSIACVDILIDILHNNSKNKHMLFETSLEIGNSVKNLL